MSAMHTISQAKLDAILTADPTTLAALDDGSLRKASEILDQRVTIHGVWSLESDYRDSVLVMLSVDGTEDDECFVIVRGNAGRQAMELHNYRRTPAARVLRKVSLGEDRYLYTWKVVRS